MTKGSEMERAWEVYRTSLVELFPQHEEFLEQEASIKKIFLHGYQAAKSAYGWVRIEDLKEPKGVYTLGWWLWPTGDWYTEDRCEFCDDIWWDWHGNEIQAPKYAFKRQTQLPSPPQAET